MNLFDREFETLNLLRQLCEQSVDNDELLANLQLVHSQERLLFNLLTEALKQIKNDEQRTNKKVLELDAIVKNRSRCSDSYSRSFNFKETSK